MEFFGLLKFVNHGDKECGSYCGDNSFCPRFIKLFPCGLKNRNAAGIMRNIVVKYDEVQMVDAKNSVNDARKYFILVCNIMTSSYKLKFSRSYEAMLHFLCTYVHAL